MEIKKTIVIVHVNEKYLDIANIFFRLFDKFWGNCPYEVIVSCKGDFKNTYEKKLYMASIKSSLTSDVNTIMNKFGAEYCISFLADAFITHHIDNDQVKNILQKMNEKQVDYCRLFNSSNKAKCFEPIRKKEIYGVSFIAFIASKRFVLDEFECTTDFEFEMKYLDITKTVITKNEVWEKMYALPNECFGIIHGIVKGLWIETSYKKIYLLLGNDMYTTHRIMSLKETVVFNTRLLLRKVGFSSFLVKIANREGRM